MATSAIYFCFVLLYIRCGQGEGEDFLSTSEDETYYLDREVSAGYVGGRGEGIGTPWKDSTLRERAINDD